MAVTCHYLKLPCAPVNRNLLLNNEGWSSQKGNNIDFDYEGK